MNQSATRDPETGFPVVKCTEHGGHEWVRWNPPHEIQKNTIDPLLKATHEHFKFLKEQERENEGQTPEDESLEDDFDEDEESLEEGEQKAELLARAEGKELADKERLDKHIKDKEQRAKRRVDYNARKTRRQRNALIAGGGYALLDKVRDETGRGQVGIYSEDSLVFPESALNTQAKLILKRNDKANR